MTDSKQEARARNIIKRLKMFNRKERDHLMKFALCEEPEAPRISDNLWALISRNTGTDRPHPDNMFVGMDYHLNWLYAALATAHVEDDVSIKDLENKWNHDSGLEKKDKNFRPIQQNQEDVDLIVVWLDSSTKRLQMVLIEAKLDSGWGSKQFKSKKERLGLIYQDAKNRHLDFVNWRFLLLSPGARPKGEVFTDSKSFSQDPYKWFQEPGKDGLWHKTLPVKNDLWRVKRVDDSGEEWTANVSKKATEEEDNSNGDQ